MQNIINTADWGKLRAEITPVSDKELHRSTVNYYKAPRPGYSQWIQVRPHRTHPPLPPPMRTALWVAFIVPLPRAL